MENDKTCVWVLQNIWKPNTVCQSQIPILDTLYQDPKNPQSIIWLYSNSNGILKRKNPTKSTPDDIKARFIQNFQLNAQSFTTWEQYQIEKNSDPEVGSLITDNTYNILTKSMFTEYISTHIPSNQAIQYNYQMQQDSQLQVEIKIINGRRLIKLWKEYKSDGQTIKTTLNAQNQIEKLKMYGNRIMGTLERINKLKITKITLLFNSNQQKDIFFTGTSSCIIETSRGYSRSMDVSGQNYYQARTVIRKQCGGDFCNFILNTSKLSSEEVDYDDLLKKVRLAYAGEGNREANKIKLSLAVDYLLKEKEKLMPINVVNKVPYKYVFMGKLLLQNRSTTPPIGSIYEINLSRLFSSAGKPSLAITINSKDPHLHPSRIYDGVSVCERCYDVYNTLRKIILANEKKISPLKNRLKTPNPQTKRRFNRRRITEREYYNSPIGKIGRNNINDLLADMGHAQTEFDLKINQVQLDDYFRSSYRGMTSEFQRKLINSQSPQKERRSSITPKNLDHNDPEEDIAMKFFPNDNARKWKLKGREELGLDSWKRYLNKLKTNKLSKIKPFELS